MYNIEYPSGAKKAGILKAIEESGITIEKYEEDLETQVSSNDAIEEIKEVVVVEKETVDALKAAGIDSIEKLYVANNMNYSGESVADFLNALKINDSYAGIDYKIIPGVSLSFTEEV